MRHGHVGGDLVVNAVVGIDFDLIATTKVEGLFKKTKSYTLNPSVVAAMRTWRTQLDFWVLYRGDHDEANELSASDPFDQLMVSWWPIKSMTDLHSFVASMMPQLTLSKLHRLLGGVLYHESISFCDNADDAGKKLREYIVKRFSP